MNIIHNFFDETTETSLPGASFAYFCVKMEFGGQIICVSWQHAFLPHNDESVHDPSIPRLIRHKPNQNVHQRRNVNDVWHHFFTSREYSSTPPLQEFQAVTTDGLMEGKMFLFCFTKFDRAIDKE